MSPPRLHVLAAERCLGELLEDMDFLGSCHVLFTDGSGQTGAVVAEFETNHTLGRDPCQLRGCARRVHIAFSGGRFVEVARPKFFGPVGPELDRPLF